MANNNSSQVKECLTHFDMAGESKPGSSQDTMDGSKRKHSECSSTEVTDPRQKPGAEAQAGDTQCEGKLNKEPECHMQLDKLSADRNHTVLIDVRALTLISNHKKPQTKLYLLSIRIVTCGFSYLYRTVVA